MIKLKSSRLVHLARMTVSLGAIQAVTYLLPLLALPYLARTLGVENFGRLALATALCAIFNAVVDYGFDLTATKDISRAASNLRQIKHIVISVLLAKAILILVSLGALGLIISTSVTLRQDFLLIFLCFSLVPTSILVPNWYYQGVQKIKPLLVGQIISKVLALLAIFLLVKSPNDLLVVPLTYAIPQCLVGAFLITSVLWKLKHYSVERNNIWKSAWLQLKEGFNVFLNIFSPNMYSNFSIYLLGVTAGAGSVALLDSARKVTSVADQALNTLMRAFFPSLATNSLSHKVFVVLTMFSGALLSLILFLSADTVVAIVFGEEFEGAANLLRVVAIGIIGLSAKLAFGIGFLVPMDKTGQLRNITIISSIVAMLVALVAIPAFGALGAAITIAVGRVLQGAFFYFFYRIVVREN